MLALVAVESNQSIVYERFESMFTTALGGSPMFFTTLAATGVYAWAAARSVRLASEALTASLMLFAVVGPTTSGPASSIEPWGAPLLLAAALQLALGFKTWDSRRCLAGCALMLAGWTLDLQGTWFTAYRGAIPLHLLLASVLALGATFRDPFGRFLQQLGGLLLLVYCLGAMALGSRVAELRALPYLYPLLALSLALALGFWLKNRLYLAIAATCGSVWLAFSLTRGFGQLRTIVVGLDQIAWGLVFFLFAAAISLWKAGYLRRWPPRPPPHEFNRAER